jgi:hypothetical protein
VTVAPGILAPLGSVTNPPRLALPTCALKSVAGSNKVANRKTRQNSLWLRDCARVIEKPPILFFVDAVFSAHEIQDKLNRKQL